MLNVLIVGYHVFLHKFVVLEAPEQGIPSTKIYCTMKSNRMQGYSDVRFDWISVLEGISKVKVICQLSALWELRVTSKACDADPVSFFYFSCFPTKSHSTERGRQHNFKSFTTVQYNLYGRDKQMRLITEKIDLIGSPEVVIPMSMKSNDYVIRDKNAREECKFYHIPYSFLLREDWDTNSVNLNATYNDTIRQSPSARLYVQSDRRGRDDLFDTLIATIKSNKVVTEELPDHTIIQGALLQSR